MTKNKINGKLFSGYFITEGIKKTKDYETVDYGKILKLYDKINELYNNFAKRKTPNEAVTEEDLIRPILRELGYSYLPQQHIDEFIPDYFLFADDTDKREFDESEKPLYYKAISILEAKKWKRTLDKGDDTDPIDSRVPSNQILSYLNAIERASNKKIMWGILTNGKIWRLYYQGYSPRKEGYFEVNLGEIFFNEVTNSSGLLFDTITNKKELIEKFKIFYLFFRKDALIKIGNYTFLQIAINEGKKWEEKITKNLKDKIFEDVFVDLAKGLLYNTEQEGQKVTLKDIYENTLVFLYRLLFVFYAEDMNLLPTTETEYSLTKIRNEIQSKLINFKTEKKIKEKIETSFSEELFTYWNRLKAIFKIIDKGNARLKIPLYNGKLFNSKIHNFLERFSIPDYFLVPSIDKLSREYSKDEAPKWINYSNLSIKHLGSLYEGLLEFRLEKAKIRLKKLENSYIPADDTDNENVVEINELYLTNDKFERKSTGSYYTDDNIVKYLVKRTIEPLISKKIETFIKWIEQVKSIEYNNEKRTKKLKEKDPAIAILELKLLDPAIGSGHFLLEIVNYISDRLEEIINTYSGKKYFGEYYYISPIIKILGETRDKLIEKCKKEKYSVDETKIDDTNLIKRLILKKCIYGIDINPLAIELAKVSLWLHTFTIGAPLSFLDHHLKCGNSLIGTEPEKYKQWLELEQKEQYSIFGNAYMGDIISADGFIELIEDTPDIELEDINENNRLYEKAEEILQPYRKLLDVFLATTFVNSQKKINIENLINGFKGNPLEVIKNEDDLLIDALNIAKEKHFFHWELEFPEIWYGKNGRKENNNFDVVIGNPPWNIIKPAEKEFFIKYDARLTKYGVDKKDARKIITTLLENTIIKEKWEKQQLSIKTDSEYYRSNYECQSDKINGKTVSGDLNYYKLFLERAYQFLKNEGYMGFVVPSGLYTDAGAKGLRRLFFDNSNVQELYCFENRKGIFPDVHKSFKFILFISKKEATTSDFYSAFMLHNINILEKTPKKALKLDWNLMKKLSPDSFSIIEFKSQKDINIVKKMCNNPLLKDSNWLGKVILSNEFHMTNDSNLYNTNKKGLILYEGKMIEQYTPYFSKNNYWIEEEIAKEKLYSKKFPKEFNPDKFDEIMKRIDNKKNRELVLNAYKKDNSKNIYILKKLKSEDRAKLLEILKNIRIEFDYKEYRIGFRAVASSTNKRSMIASIFPKNIFYTNSLIILKTYDENWDRLIDEKHFLYLCGIFNSFVFDYFLRLRITTNLNMFYIYQMPIPIAGEKELSDIVKNVVMLTENWEDFEELRKRYKVKAKKLNKNDRLKIMADIDKTVAKLYGLEKEDMKYVLDKFHHKDSQTEEELRLLERLINS